MSQPSFYRDDQGPNYGFDPDAMSQIQWDFFHNNVIPDSDFSLLIGARLLAFAWLGGPEGKRDFYEHQVDELVAFIVTRMCGTVAMILRDDNGETLQ